MKLSTHLHLMLKLRMGGALPLLPHMIFITYRSGWSRGAQILGARQL